MALTAANRGTGSNNTSGTTVNIVPTQNFTTGSTAILGIAFDNSGAQGSNPFNSAINYTDSSGNVWIPTYTFVNDPGAANAGVAAALLYCTVGTLGTGTTIPITFTASTTNKAWIFVELTPGVDFITSFYSLGSTTSSNSTTTPSVSATPLAAGNFVIGFTAVENTVSITSDTDTLNGSWSTAQNQTVGTGTTGVTAFSQWKIVTATGVQQFNPVISATSDSVTISNVFTELAVAKSFDPMGRMGFFGI